MDTIRIKRLKQRMSQWDMANKTGISQSRISLIENNHVVPRPEELAQIAGVLGVSVDELQVTMIDSQLASESSGSVTCSV